MLTPAFDVHETSYTVQISNETTTLNILAVSENEQGTVSITGNDNLKEGNNTIKVNVTAPDGVSKREYKINAYKRNIAEEEKYKEEQSQNEEKLQDAYEVEKTSQEAEDILEEAVRKDNGKYIVIRILIVIVIVGIVIVLVYSKKRKSRKSI